VSTYAQDLERAYPDRFTDVMAKSRREGGRQLLDWLHNNAAKTTAIPYTLRAGPRHWCRLRCPARRWSKRRVEDLQITLEQLVERIPEGDLLAALLDLGQAPRLPTPAASSPSPARRAPPGQRSRLLLPE
jgi:bifunctional non-homologous end joining protein LigD